MNTLFTGQTLIKLESVDSTNSYALNMCKNSEPAEGTLVWAIDQFAGRGQRGNTWKTESGKNLTCSLILRPGFLKATEQYYLNAAIAVGVRNYLQKKTKEPVVIKWPNDILVGKEKIAGILIENSLQGMNIQYSVIGMGININQTEFPENIRATSLAVLNKKTYSLEKELTELCSVIEYIYLRFRPNPELIMHEYKKHLFGLNKEMMFLYKNTTIKAIIYDVSKEGRLLLKKDTGTIISCDFKEIKFLF